VDEMARFFRHADGSLYKVDDVRARLTQEERSVGPVKVQVPVIKLETLSGRELKPVPKLVPTPKPEVPTPAGEPVPPIEEPKL
jgi:hypothetical protein